MILLLYWCSIMNNRPKAILILCLKIFYTIDKDITHEIKQDKLTFLIDNNPIATKGLTVHAMNKYSLEELL